MMFTPPVASRVGVAVSCSCPPSVSDLQLEHDELLTNGLRSGLENREISATTEPDLRGRTVRGRQPRHEALSEKKRENSSDLPHLGLDPAHNRTGPDRGRKRENGKSQKPEKKAASRMVVLYRIQS